ncbi:MAG: YfhO family protein [Candidatus Borkfalkiaceae bacterium]|nr:YfhO family protein [Christensenellaceae bacterium]
MEFARKFFRGAKYFLSPAVVFLLFFLIAKRSDLYPFGTQSVSWCDMNQQVIPILCNLKDVLSGKASLFMSYGNAGGMNFYGVYMFYASSPLNLLVAFVGKEEIALFVNVLVMLKMMLAGATACLFFFSRFGEKRILLCLALSVLYAFSGYVLMYYQILAWLDCVYLFPLVMLGLERMKQGKSVVLYSVSLFLHLWCSFYLSYMTVVFLLLYAGLSAWKEKDRKFCYKFVIGSFVALLLSAIVYLPVAVQYFSSARTGSVLANLKNSGIITSYTTALPTVFCLTAVLPFFFGRNRSAFSSFYSILLVLTAIPLILEPINKMWHTGSYMAFPSRYAFITIFLGLTVAGENVLSSRRLEKKEEKTAGKADCLPWLLVGGAVLVLACCVVGYQEKYFLAHSSTLTKYVSSLWGNEASFNGLVTVYAVVLLFAVAVRVLYACGLLKNVFLGLTLFVLAFGESSFSSRVYLSSAAHDTAKYQSQMALADRIEDGEFYRVGLPYKTMDVNTVGAMGYNSLGHYTSLTSGDYMDGMKSLGYSSYWMEVGQYGGTAFSDALFCQKYVIRNGSSSSAIYSSATFHITENEFFLPLGIVVPDGNLPSTLSGERTERTESVWRAIGGTGDLITVFPFGDAAVSGMEAKYEDGVYTFSDFTSSKGKIVYHVYVEGRQRLYFDCFDLYSTALRQHVNDSFAVKVNGSTISSSYPTQKQNGFLFLGEFENRTVDVEITLLKEFYGSSFAVFGEDVQKLKNYVDEVISAHCSVEGNRISGKVTAKSGEYLLLSLPFDRGYTARVNGKKVGTEKVLGDLIAIPLAEGENEIGLTFVPSGFAAGAAISLCGVLLLAFLVAFGEKKLYNRNRRTDKAEECCRILCMFAGIAVYALLYVFPMAVSLFSV